MPKARSTSADPLVLYTDSILTRPPIGSLSDARHELFAREYIKDSNARRAAAVAGYDPEQLHVIGYNPLADPDLMARIDALIAERRHRLKADHGLALEQLLAIDKFDVRSLYDDQVNLLPVHLWPPEAGQTAASVEVTNASGDTSFSVTKKSEAI